MSLRRSKNTVFFLFLLIRASEKNRALDEQNKCKVSFSTFIVLFLFNNSMLTEWKFKYIVINCYNRKKRKTEKRKKEKKRGKGSKERQKRHEGKESKQKKIVWINLIKIENLYSL